MSETKTKNAHQRWLAVIADTGTVEKKGFNSYQNYSYVRELELMEAARAACVKHGLLIVPNIDEWEQQGEITQVFCSYTLYNVDDPQDQIVVRFPGTGHDKLDKGVYKAITGSEKYFLMKSFMIASDDDPENEKQNGKPHHVTSAPPAPRKQAAPPATTGTFKYKIQHADKDVWTKAKDCAKSNGARFDKDSKLWISPVRVAELEAFLVDGKTNGTSQHATQSELHYVPEQDGPPPFSDDDIPF